MDDKFEEFNFTSDMLLTREARKVSDIMKKGSMRTAIQLANARFVVMGPGEGKEGFESRLMIKDLIEKEKKQVALFPEKVSRAQLGDLLTLRGVPITDLEALARTPVGIGYLLMFCTDITIILLMSPGAISEFSIYFTMKDVGHKIRVYYPEVFAGDKSFIRSGPIELFEGVYSQVHTFKDGEELRLKVGEMVDKYLIYLSIARF